MADWSTIASLATAGGTLVLGVATFASVRSSQRTARIAERSLLIGLRPLLVTGREDDPAMTVLFGDGHIVTIAGGLVAVDRQAERLYFVMPLRNVGSGLGVLHSWYMHPRASTNNDGHAPLEQFRPLSRDLYIPVGDRGFWQGALRDPLDEMRHGIDAAIASGAAIVVDLLYGDGEGGQRTVTRFVLHPDEHDGWFAGAVRHWRVDGIDPR